GGDIGYRIDLRQVDLGGANMAGLNFCHALFNESDLSYVDFSLTKLDGAGLNHSVVRKSYMCGSLFMKLGLVSTEFYATQFNGAAFIDTNLAVSKISDEQINSAFGDASVTLPADIPRPDHWATEKLDWPDFRIQWRDWQKSIGFTLPENTP
ncbi:MAG: pentapeptide repeat-containing protein, partial [Marinosulfonomonas sp.]|nr:pentapeptide repeat-containing protein [Marinosulfonomonas sp.]